ncbi:phosphate:acyl-[acyl carrier protein] acyltransferase [Litorimonas taeanensis]|uniref:Phosphate acyltransferase n=1 Tax=Litorimonas taeanensis TaxID=568099 RepID=A0A420WKH1_9PROT|nr:phosphate acyltransferase PlsX [Litorimonas taeanensis]RKQ71422.1 phosphate:acyl-[acyl carrier protein] acyltransferase [Litorimonas taeanensis]
MLDGLVVSVDAMGGDDAPDVVIHGIEYFLKHEGKGRRARFLLHGDQPRIDALLKKAPLTRERSEVCHTELSVSMDEKPSQAMRKGKGSSLWNSILAVKEKRANIVLSAGNTGALMAMSIVILKRMPGIQRPALIATWPRVGSNCVVLDVGANVEASASQLSEFAVLGDAFYRALYNVQSPTIGLLNVGVEEQKGNAQVKAAHERLTQSDIGLNYIGFVEGNDISLGEADVIVTDGFTGNITIKAAEGTAKFIEKILKEALAGSIWSKFTSALNAMALLKAKKRMDPRKVNGGVLLGVNGAVIKSHGGTDKVGYANALNIAIGLAESNFLEEIEREVEALHDEDDNIGFVG